MSSRGAALIGVVALLMLQFLWHGVLAPPRGTSAWLYAAFFCLPLLPAILLALRSHRAAAFAGAIAALLYFCHGVMEAMSATAERQLALIEIVLSTWIIVAASWPGLRGRFRKKAKGSE